MTFLLACAVSNTVYFIMQKPYLLRMPPVTITAAAYFNGFLCKERIAKKKRFSFVFVTFYASTAFCIIMPVYSYVNVTSMRLSRSSIAAVLFAAVFNSLLKYALQSKINQRVSVATVMLWNSLVVCQENNKKRRVIVLFAPNFNLLKVDFFCFFVAYFLLLA